VSEPVLLEVRPASGRELPVRPGATIGREGDIAIDDGDVSRQHAQVRLVEATAMIEDLGSTNGTFVNEERIAGAVALADGDLVRIGATVWRFQATAGHSGARPDAGGAGPAGHRGEVPPPDLTGSAVHRAIASSAQPPGEFAPEPSRRRASAARRMGATVLAVAVVVLTAAAVVIYLAMS